MHVRASSSAAATSCRNTRAVAAAAAARVCRLRPISYTRLPRPSSIIPMATKDQLMATPGVCAAPDAETKRYVFQQTMLRVKDPAVSLDFYTRVLGMTLICKLDFPDMAFTLYFLAYCDPAEIPEDPKERARWMFSRPACLELTHNHGTERDPEFKGYCNGNADPGRGFGHIGLAVPDVDAACARFERLGVEFVKRPDDGKMKGLAFVKDPDSYWIEILNPEVSQHFGTS